MTTCGPAQRAPRTRPGERSSPARARFEIAPTHNIPQLEALAADERLIDALVPAAEMMPLMASVRDIRRGRDFPASPFRAQTDAKHVKAVTRQGGGPQSVRKPAAAKSAP